MPNASISVYMSDSEFIKYLEHKTTINAKAREVVKKEVKI